MSKYNFVLQGIQHWGYKTESTNVKDTVAVVSNIHIKTPAAPIYEIQLLSTAEIPRVNMLRNKVSENQC